MAPSKLMFLQRRQDSSIIARDTSRFSSNIGMAIRTPLKVRRETQDPFPVATEILGFLSIFKRSQALSASEALTSAFLSIFSQGCDASYRNEVGNYNFLCGSTGLQTLLHLVR